MKNISKVKNGIPANNSQFSVSSKSDTSYIFWVSARFLLWIKPYYFIGLAQTEESKEYNKVVDAKITDSEDAAQCWKYG